MANALTKKAGPLPVWAWGILGGIAVYFLYTRYSSSSANSATNSPVATALDPNQVDPTTGLTYGQELAGSYPSAGALQGAADSATSAPSLDSQLNDFGTLLGDFNAIAGQLGYTPPNPSTTTAAAAASPPVDNSTPVATPGVTPAAVSSITTHPGGAFYKYYQKVTGHPPPATLTTNNVVYQMWKGGVKAVATKNPSAHRAKTIFAANPAGHQHTVSKPKSTASPQPVKHPAGGGNPGKVQSGSHEKPTTAPASAGHPVTRAPAHKPPPKPKPTRRRGP